MSDEGQYGTNHGQSSWFRKGGAPPSDGHTHVVTWNDIQGKPNLTPPPVVIPQDHIVGDWSFNRIAVGDNINIDPVVRVKVSAIEGVDTWSIHQEGNVPSRFDGTISAGQATAGSNSEAFGAGASAKGNYAVALGHNATANGLSSVAIGWDSYSNANRSVSIGYDATAGTDSIAIGYKATTGGTADSICIGSAATAKFAQSIALGYNADTTQQNEMMVGSIIWEIDYLEFKVSGTYLTWNNSVTIVGNFTVTPSGSGSLSDSIGVGALASGDQAVAIGRSSVASVDYTLAVGANSSVTANNAVALGYNANVSANYGIAIGHNSDINNVNSIAIGFGATASYDDAICLGYGATASQANEMMIGSASSEIDYLEFKLSGTYLTWNNPVTIIGNLSVRPSGTGTQSEAFGASASATGTYSVAVGYSVSISANNGVAVGYNADISALYGVAIGHNSDVDGAGGIAIGQGATALFSGSIGIGKDATPSAANEMVVGASGYEIDTFRAIVSGTYLRIGNSVELFGDFKFDATQDAKFVWGKYTAASATLNYGTTASTVSDLQTANDGTLYTITEATGSPGIELVVSFTNVNAFNWVKILATYSGSSTHGISIELYNSGTVSWDRFDAMQNGYAGAGTVFENHDFFIPDVTNYINSGVVSIRILHFITGNISHRLYIEECSLYQ